MLYKARLLNNKLDDSTATIYVKTNGVSVVYSVNTSNPKMKKHIEEVLTTEYYSISPGYSTNKEATVCVLKVEPYTVEQSYLIPEILGWKGYNVEEDTDIQKAYELDGIIVYKSSGDIINNAQGERIVKRVPKGMLAVSDDGRVVSGGKRININIDKEGATWHLVENPYEGMSPEARDTEKEEVNLGFGEYHPGIENEIYEEDKEGDDTPKYHTLRQGYDVPENSMSLNEFYADSGYGVTESEEVKEVSDIPSRLPTSIKDGYILFSPESRYALPSKLWPPIGIEGFQDMEWLVFEAVDTDNEDEIEELRVFGMTPALISGVNSKIVRFEPEEGEEIDISEGFKLELDTSSVSSDMVKVNIQVNSPLKRKVTLDDISTPENIAKIERAREYIDTQKEYVNYRETESSYPTLSPDIDKLQINGQLQGGYASMQIELRPEQKPVVNAMTHLLNYEKFGGPLGQSGYYINATYGFGKTAVICAADAVLRNNGTIKTGEQVTLITAPTKNIFVWQSEIAKFRAEGAVVISGSKGERVQQWMNLMEQAQSGELPNFVVVAASKFRLTDEKVIEDEEEKREIDMDAKFMKLLALGGSVDGKDIKGGHIGALTMDETSQYINPDSSRFLAAREISEAVYYGKGITWMLNGDLSDNSATDTLAQIALSNNVIRNNLDDAILKWTLKDSNRPSSNSRIWKSKDGALKDFSSKFGQSIFTVDGKMVAGDKYGLSSTPDAEVPIGRNWGNIYNDTFDKMRTLSEIGSKSQKMKVLGMLSILINSSYGAVQPARLLEYELGTGMLMGKLKNLLSDDLYENMKDEVKQFLMHTTEESIAGRTPKDGLSVSDRDKAYEHYLSLDTRNALQMTVDSWDNPALDTIMKQLDDEIKNTPPGENVKLGVAGFSKRTIQTLYRKLTMNYDNTKVKVMKFDGDTDNALVREQMQEHEDEKNKHVISLVTSAGLYGLSLPAVRSWGFPNWNPGKSGQFTGRFHRNPRQVHLSTTVVPKGVCEYMRYVETNKKGIQNQLKSEIIDFDIVDIDDENSVTGGIGSITKLMDKLEMYRPSILSKESSDEQ